MCHTQRAPTWTSLVTSWPLRWRATSDSRPPMQVPPMKTEGAAGLRGGGEPESESSEGRAAISWSSNSMTVGWTPMLASNFFITWHMQHEDRLKIITGCSDISLLILASADSATSIDSIDDDDEEDDDGGGGGSGGWGPPPPPPPPPDDDDGDDRPVRSSLTMSFEQRRRPCITGCVYVCIGKKQRERV